MVTPKGRKMMKKKTNTIYVSVMVYANCIAIRLTEMTQLVTFLTCRINYCLYHVDKSAISSFYCN